MKLHIKMRTAQKIVITFVLSSACILVYQYQLSRTPFMSQDSSGNSLDEEVVHLKLLSNVVVPQQQLLLQQQQQQQQETITSTTSTSSTYLTNKQKNKTSSTFSSSTNYSSSNNEKKKNNKFSTHDTTNNNNKNNKSDEEDDSSTKLNVRDSGKCTCDDSTLSAGTQGHLPPPLYVITPTYKRPQMLAELTRLGYTLKHVPNLYWLVVEDAKEPTALVTNLLKKFNIPFEHLTAQMPEKFKKAKVKPRGVANRLRALEWIKANASNAGVFYFADDDNTYDVDIFNEMRYTKKVSMWPVGLIDKYGVSSPIVKNGTIVDFYDFWKGGRKFPVDMASFAVNIQFYLSRPNATMPFKAGYEEDGFLRSLAPLTVTEIEPLASNCTKVAVWHTQTRHYASTAAVDKKKYHDTNLIELREMLL